MVFQSVVWLLLLSTVPGEPLAEPFFALQIDPPLLGPPGGVSLGDDPPSVGTGQLQESVAPLSGIFQLISEIDVATSEERARIRQKEEADRRKVEKVRLAQIKAEEESRLTVEAQLVEVARLAKDARLAEEARLVEVARLAEEARLVEKSQVKAGEEDHPAEEEVPLGEVVGIEVGGGSRSMAAEVPLGVSQGEGAKIGAGEEEYPAKNKVQLGEEARSMEDEDTVPWTEEARLADESNVPANNGSVEEKSAQVDPQAETIGGDIQADPASHTATNGTGLEQTQGAGRDETSNGKVWNSAQFIDSSGLDDIDDADETAASEATLSENLELPCLARWPSRLASGGALDRRTFLEVCTDKGPFCTCAYAAVERFKGDTRGNEAEHDDGPVPLEHGSTAAARFVVYMGRAPKPSSGRASKETELHGDRRMAWTSTSADAEIDSSISDADRLFVVLRGDGNVILSRKHPRLERREVLWETASGGELHNRYNLELKLSNGTALFEVYDESESKLVYSSTQGDVSQVPTISLDEDGGYSELKGAAADAFAAARKHAGKLFNRFNKRNSAK